MLAKRRRDPPRKTPSATPTATTNRMPSSTEDNRYLQLVLTFNTHYEYLQNRPKKERNAGDRKDAMIRKITDIRIHKSAIKPFV